MATISVKWVSLIARRCAIARITHLTAVALRTHGTVTAAPHRAQAAPPLDRHFACKRRPLRDRPSRRRGAGFRQSAAGESRARL